MNAHQVSQLTNAARTAPVVITANKDEVAGQPIKENVYLNYVKEDSLEVDQREPENFKPISNRERSNVDSFTMDRSHLTSQFYGKIQELKNEHQKTLTLLNQFYEQEKNKSTDGTKAAMKRRQINYLAPDYLDNTENNTFFYGNTPYRGPDKVPGYTKADFDSRSSQEKSDDMKDFSDDVSEIVSDSDSIDVINRMWDEFSIDKYSDAGNRRPEKNDTKCQYVANKQRPQSATTKKKEWKPVITIPKPFNMTLRDEKKSEKSHTRSSMDVSLRQKIKEEEEEQERRKRIRARDPPTHIYLPLYEEMCERREQRSRFNKQTSVSATLAIQKPFSFAERDERALKIQKMKKNEVEAERLAEIKSSTNFEAQPIPRGVVDSSAGDRRSEDVLYRRIKAKMRAEDLIRSSAYPPRMRAHEALSKHKKQVWLKEIESESACTFRPRISNPPDFNALHKRESIEIANRHSASEVVVQPFTLHTSLRSKSRMSVSEGQSNPGKSPLKLGKMPSFSDTIPTRMTDSSRQRMNNTWRSLEDAELVMKRGKIGDAEQAERRRMLARKVKQRAAINDGSASAVASHDERSRRNKKELHERQVDYNQFLRDVKRKVDERPLLIEQHDERVAKEQAERKYAKILEESGLSPDLLNKNGRSDSRTDDYATSMSRDILWTNNSVIPSETVTVKSSMKPLMLESSPILHRSELEPSHDRGDNLKQSIKVKKSVEFA